MQKSASTNEATPYAPAYYDDIKAGSLRSARVVLPLVLDIVAPHSVLDVGCGVGYLEAPARAGPPAARRGHEIRGSGSSVGR